MQSKVVSIMNLIKKKGCVLSDSVLSTSLLLVGK